MSQTTTILYIEDDLSSQTLVSRVLAADGYEVIIVENGEDAITQVPQVKPDLILLETNISGLDIKKISQQLRNLVDMKNIPLIALISDKEGNELIINEAGLDGYIAKPIDVDRFPRQIEKFVEGKTNNNIVQSQPNDYLAEYNQQLVDHLENEVIALKEINRKLQNLEESKSTLVLHSTRELHKQLNSIHRYARLLLATEVTKYQFIPGISEVLFLTQKIFDSMNRLNEMVNDILNVSLVEAHYLSLDLHNVSLETIINATLIELDPFEKGRDLIINVSPPPGTLPPVQADENKLYQVFWNLLSNAIKYTPNGGSINVDAIANGDSIHIKISDSGIGISPENQKNLFGAIDLPETTNLNRSKVGFRAKGVGLGLHIVKQIIQAHHGRIWVDSSGIDGEGSIFHIELPINQPKSTI